MKYRICFVLVVFMALLPCMVFSAFADSNGYLVKFIDGYLPDIYQYNLKEVNAGKGIYTTDDLGGLKTIDEYIEYTSQNSSVSLIRGEEPVSMLSLPQDPAYPDQWNLECVNADAGWELEAYGNDIKVAVIDSGCFEHDDLKGNLLKGKNYLDGTHDVTDNDGHGTHVSGIIAAQMDGYGIAGVAPKAKIVPLKCFDPSTDTYAEDILDAIYDAVDVYQCDIINMSWCVQNDNPFLKKAIDYADSKGVILVAAVGNYSSKTLCYPAAYENVIGVSSIAADKTYSSFAQYNDSVLVTAPGERIISTFNDGSYRYGSGTSQATPLVSGIAAIALSINEKMTSAQFRQMLIETTEDLGDMGYDVHYGYGLVDEAAFLNNVMKSIDYYVSPINVLDGNAYVLIKNNTLSVLNAVSIFSEYNSDRFAGCAQEILELYPDEEKIVRINNSSNKISHFLWSSFDSLAPVAEKREKK